MLVSGYARRTKSTDTSWRSKYVTNEEGCMTVGMFIWRSTRQPSASPRRSRTGRLPLLYVVGSFYHLRRAFADDDAGHHRIASRNPWHHRRICNTKVVYPINL